MKIVKTFKTDETASEVRRLLKERGIEARIVVDPLESRYPALSHFSEVAVMVQDEAYVAASRMMPKAG